MIRNKLLLAGYSALIAAGLSGNAAAQGVSGDGEIRSDDLASPLVIKTSTNMAGAIESLTWNGKEFINKSDHGREMQSSAFLAILNESELRPCYNPNEAGSRYDGAPTRPSSSRLLSFSAQGNTLSSSSYPAYWKNCVRDDPSYLNTHYRNDGIPFANDPIITGFVYSVSNTAGGTTKPSTLKFSKSVTIGFQGHPGIIEYKTIFDVPDSYAGPAGSSPTPFTEIAFEPLTAYMPMATVSEFFMYRRAEELIRIWDSSFKKIDPITGETKIVPIPTETPLIFSSVDGSHAMAIYAPYILDLPVKNISDPPAETTMQQADILEIAKANQYSVERSFNGDDNAANVVKWNVVAFRENLKPDEQPFALSGESSFTQYVVVGTKAHVLAEIKWLHDTYFRETQGTIKGVVGPIKSSANGPLLSGWACGTYTEAPVAVDLYLGAPVGAGGQKIGRFSANRRSDDKSVRLTAAATCRAYGYHGFAIPLSSLLANYAGQKIYVYGISPTGRGNPALVNSGIFTVPVE